MEFQVTDSNFDEIQEAKLAETGTYKMILTKQEILPNRAEDGQNLVLSFSVIDEPSLEGISFSVYRALPKPGDSEKMTKRGQSYKDFKLSLLKEFVDKLGGSTAGDGFNVPDDIIITAMVEKKFSDEGRPFNTIVEETIVVSGGEKLDF